MNSGAMCAPMGRGRCPRTVARSQIPEDPTRTQRWPARAKTALPGRSRAVRSGRIGRKCTTRTPSVPDRTSPSPRGYGECPARATRTTRLARKARSLPCLSAQDRARSSLPPAIGTKATRRPGAAGRCGSPRWPWCGVVGSQRDTKGLQNQQVPWAAPQHMAVARACWAEGRPERRPRVVRRACFQLGRATELPTDAQTARRAPKTTRPKPEPSARCVGKFLALHGGGRERWRPTFCVRRAPAVGSVPPPNSAEHARHAHGWSPILRDLVTRG